MLTISELRELCFLVWQAQGLTTMQEIRMNRLKDQIVKIRGKEEPGGAMNNLEVYKNECIKKGYIEEVSAFIKIPILKNESYIYKKGVRKK